MASAYRQGPAFTVPSPLIDAARGRRAFTVRCRPSWEPNGTASLLGFRRLPAPPSLPPSRGRRALRKGRRARRRSTNGEGLKVHVKVLRRGICSWVGKKGRLHERWPAWKKLAAVSFTSIQGPEFKTIPKFHSVFLHLGISSLYCMAVPSSAVSTHFHMNQGECVCLCLLKYSFYVKVHRVNV